MYIFYAIEETKKIYAHTHIYKKLTLLLRDLGVCFKYFCFFESFFLLLPCVVREPFYYVFLICFNNRSIILKINLKWSLAKQRFKNSRLLLLTNLFIFVIPISNNSASLLNLTYFRQKIISKYLWNRRPDLCL